MPGDPDRLPMPAIVPETMRRMVPLHACDVQVRIAAHVGSWDFRDRWIDWGRLEPTERERLSELLEQALSTRRPTL